MADHFDTNTDKMRREIDEILHRVDQLPELDNRSPEEIIGYDENGIPAAHKPEPAAAPNDQAMPIDRLTARSRRSPLHGSTRPDQTP